MTNPTTKVLLTLLTLALMTGAASAQSPHLSPGTVGQQRTFYDPSGKVVVRSSNALCWPDTMPRRGLTVHRR